ncbi:hypothetical protein ABEB22_08820 [Thioclava sp. 'Guangxiensis']|uniref:hypothetical protein n=1 Tax=Thioclava sp. 'Guangxiensis' TaxID=3149044 RepID=UPI003877E645
MNIIFSPIVRRPGTDYELHMLSVEGDTLTVNGTDYDLTALEYNEDTGLAGYIQSATRDAASGWTVTLLLPIGDNASEAQRFPDPVTVASGPVPLPAPPDPEANETST